MNTHIRANKLELSDATKEYISKKTSVLEKYCKGESPADLYVEIEKTTAHHKSGDIFRAEFNLHLAGRQFRSASETANLYSSIDEAQEEIVSEIRDSKNRDTTVFRRGARKIKEMMHWVYNRGN